MRNKLFLTAILCIFYMPGVWGQQPPPPPSTVPLYRVTVVDRTISAVDYQYRNGPTPIDFRGTVLMPKAKGSAIVESKAGRTEVDVHFDHLQAAQQFGPEYLTYVLWAITPNGHARNLGEVLAGTSDKAKLLVTTELQAFGMIVTAEPFAAVRQPSDVVVLENMPRPDTIGGQELIQAKYELLPRGQYTYDMQQGMSAAAANAPKVSWDRYQSLVELYEAQNAVQIAQASGAANYAPDTFAKAQELLRQAQDANNNKAGMTMVVTLARQAEQNAEDARILAEKRKQGDELGDAQRRVALAEARAAQAEAAAQTAQTQAAAANALLVQERAARRQEEDEARAAASAPAPPPPPAQIAQIEPPPDREAAHKKELRFQLYEQLNSSLPARDTPRGLTVTLADADFRGAHLNPSAYERLAHIAVILRQYPELTVEVDGNEAFSIERAQSVREILVGDGMAAGSVTARSLGDTRPLTSNATPSGREQNRRVEIVVSGRPIGDMPYWAKSYQLKP